MQLILVRHAKAAPGEPDAERPLTPEGEAAAQALGETLASRRPDAVVSSPLLRTRQTAAAIAAAVGLEPAVDDRLAPGTTLASLRAAVEGRGATVVAVGHQPDCSEIVFELTGREVAFPVGAFAEVEL